MKKFLAAVFLLCIGIIFAAVWFSPLITLGEVKAYADNKAIAVVDGVCYSHDGIYRVDFTGEITDMFNALDGIGAKQVKRVDNDGMCIVYAFSPRVCCKKQATSEGDLYNVMAVWASGTISIGTPILSGCY